jgi:hypothetical protein
MLAKLGCLGLLAIAILALTAGPGSEDAEATTYCVPNLSACPVSGGVAETVLEKAMGGLAASDGQADQIFIAEGTYVETGSYEPPNGVFKNPGVFEPEGSDDLTITGAGIEDTYLTSGGTENIVLLDLSAGGNSRDIVVRDLTVQIPSSFPNGLGAGLRLLAGDVAEGIAVESLNAGSDGVLAGGAGSVFRGGEVLPGTGGTLGVAFRTSSEKAGMLVEGTHIFGAATNLNASGKESALVARRVFAEETTAYGAGASEGSVTVENSVIRMSGGVGLFVSPNSNDASVEADHVTIVDEVSGNPALEAKKFGATAGDGTISVTNSILRGFGSGHRIESPGGSGVLRIEASYSNLSSGGSNTGGVTDFDTGNINADPLFNADLSLPAGSPSVDAGDPGAGLPTDFLDAPRPNDGNGDGVAVRDQGAYEYQRPLPPGGGGGGSGSGGGGGGTGEAADKAPPQTTIAKGPGSKLTQGKAKFAFRSSERGSRFQCKLDGRKVRTCKSPKGYAGLKPGLHTFKVWAIDAAGNKDPTPAKRRFRVP